MTTFIQKYLAQFNLETFFFEAMTKAFSIFLLCLVFYIAKQTIRFSIKKVLTPSLKLSNSDVGRQKTISRLVENLLNYLLYFIILYVLLTILGLPVSSLLAGAGIAGVAIGLGAQGFLSDLVNGFFILLEHQFDVGDRVKLTNGPITITGVVVSVGIRTTQVRDADGTLHFIPNRNILVVSNQSRGDMRAQIDLPLYANTDLETVQRVIKEVNRLQLPHYDVITGVTIAGPQTGATGQFVYRIYLFVSNDQQSQMSSLFYALYQEALLAAGVDLPTATILVSAQK